MAFTGNEDHSYDWDDAKKLTKKYRDQMSPGDRKGGYFSKAAIQSLLDQDKCVGIRYYYGLDDNDDQVMVVVGVESDENDLVGGTYICLEASMPCPPYCGNNNIINS